MKETLRLGTYIAAFMGLLVGVGSNMEPTPQPEEISPSEIQKIYDYHRVGNYEGLVDLSRRLPKDVPKYQDLQELRRTAEGKIQAYKRKLKEGSKKAPPTDRMPAAVRDSYYDAFVAMDRGECLAAYQNMIVVRKYTDRPLDEVIFSLCKSRREPASEKINRVLELTGNKSK